MRYLREQRLKPGVFLGICVVALIIGSFFIWWPLFVEGRVPVDGNVIREIYPNWRITREAWISGHFPLWNTFRNFGEPHLADPKMMALYPIFWLLLPLASYLNFVQLWFLAHAAIAAGFTARWVNRAHGDRAGIVTAAALAAWNGFFLLHGMCPSHLASAAWLPAAVYFHTVRAPVAMAIVLALQWLAGYPPFSVLTVILLLAMAIVRRDRLRDLAAAGLVALGLSAAHLVPFIQLMMHTSRPLVLDPAKAIEFSVPPIEMAKMLVIPQWISWFPTLSADIAMAGFYVGPFALLLALWGAYVGHSRERWIALGAGAAVLLSLGRYLPGYAHVPFFRIFRFPASWLLVATVLITLLAAAGVARIRRPAARWLAAGLVCFDLLIFGSSMPISWMPAARLETPPALVQTMSSERIHNRIYHSDQFKALWLSTPADGPYIYDWLRETVTPSYGMAFGVREANGYQVLRLSRADRLLARLDRAGPQSVLAKQAGIQVAILTRRNAQAISPDNVRTLMLPDPAQPAFFVEAGEADRIEMTDFRSGSVSVQTASDLPRRLVLSEIAYPHWIATIDGRRTRVEIFEDAFVSVLVPAGTHRVHFRYVSMAFALGVVLSLGTILFLIAFTFFGFRPPILDRLYRMSFVRPWFHRDP